MTTVLVALALALLAAHLASVALVLLRMLRSVPRVASLPRVALLRPVCGLDPFDAETLGTSFRLDYPDCDLIFCAASEDDAAVPLVRELIAAHPGTGARLLIGDDRLTGNPKLNNLLKGWAASDAPFVAMTDSNVILPPDYLRQLVDCWREDTGMVSSPPVGARPDGIWADLECAFLNGHQARWQLAADALGLGFAQGKTLFASRQMVDRAGGLAVLGGDLAEDVACTKMVRAAGKRVRLVPRPFAQPIGRRAFRTVWDRQLRWSRVRWQGFPGLFVLEPLSGPGLAVLALLVAGVMGAPLWLLPLVLALWYGAEWLMLRAMGWPWSPVASLLRDALLPVLWAATFAGRGFVWRGTAMAPN